MKGIERKEKRRAEGRKEKIVEEETKKEKNGREEEEVKGKEGM